MGKKKLINWTHSKFKSLPKKDIEKKQAKSVEDIIFTQTGVSRTVDAMGQCRCIYSWCRSASHTYFSRWSNQVLGDFDKYSGAADEVQRLGAEMLNVLRLSKGQPVQNTVLMLLVVLLTSSQKGTEETDLTIKRQGMRRKSDGDTFPFQNFFIQCRLWSNG